MIVHAIILWLVVGGVSAIGLFCFIDRWLPLFEIAVEIDLVRDGSRWSFFGVMTSVALFVVMLGPGLAIFMIVRAIIIWRKLRRCR